MDGSGPIDGRRDDPRDELALLLAGQRRLLEVSRSVLASLDLGEVLRLIAASITDLVPHDSMVICAVDWLSRTYRPLFVDTWFETPEHEAAFMAQADPVDIGITGWVLRMAEPLNLVDAHLDPRGVLVPGTRDVPEQVIDVPLMVDGGVIGAMFIARKADSDRAFTAAEFDLVQLFASFASIALRNAVAHRDLAALADMDPKTGLLNGSAFARDLAALIGRGPDLSFAVLMLDLDRFKLVNDRQGHLAGDALLRGVAEVLRLSSRSGDRAYRFGGDEFALLLDRGTADDAGLVAERVADAVAALTADRPVHVTASIGVATHPIEGTSPDDLVALADARLYASKARRRERRHRAS